MTPLFLDQSFKPAFQKIAMPVRLSQSPEAWQRDIAGEIYKQLPYVGDYAVNVILDKVDAQRGFGFGSVHVSNKTDAPMPDQTEQPSIRIPVIVRDYLMAPLDTFMDGDGVYPLTESRLREKLFRPQTFELSTRKPSDKGLVDQLYPPMRSNYGMGAMGGDSGGMGKAASAEMAFFSGLGTSKTAADAEKGRRAAIGRMHSEAASNNTNIGMKCASLVEAIAMTLSDRDRDQLVSQISDDMEIKVAALNNPSFQKLAMTIVSANPPKIEKTAEALVDSIQPNVVQFEKLADGNFRVKWANSNAFSPKEDVVPPQDASQMAGADMSKMQPGATVTLSSEKAKKQSLDESVYVKIQQFGKYRVQDMNTNQELHGWVIPIVDLEMHPLEMYVFINPGEQGTPQGGVGGINPAQQEIQGTPGAWSVQDDIAGTPLDTGNGFEELDWANHESSPQGTGFFLSIAGQCCLPPMTIQNGMQDPNGTAGLSGETMFGEPVQLQRVPGLKQVQMMGEGMYGIPDELTWVPLPGEPTFLAKDPLDITNTQEAQQAPGQVQVGSTGPGEFSMDGPPLAKVARQDRLFIKKAQAEFLLVAMGVDPLQARGILKEAESSRKGWVKCSTARPIVSLASLHTEMTKKAAKDLASFPYHLRQNLVKEASVIDDADTTDKVLAMNFINPENIDTFAKYLPDLDEASKKLAEILLGVRLGVGSIDEGAVERAMKAMETVIEGLKLLQQKVSA
jgi:hypothetical protein